MLSDAQIIDALGKAQANLRARRLITAADAAQGGLDLIARLQGELAEAQRTASEAVAKARRLAEDAQYNQHRLAFLDKELAKAMTIAQVSQIPRKEETARARKEVRELLAPYLTGEPATRMLAMTLRAELDKAWGKEKS